jgi:hypothetical protein
MNDPYGNALLVDEPDSLAILEAEDAAGPAAQLVLIRVGFETDGFGTFSAGSFNTAQGFTGALFAAGTLIPLKARPERGHRFDHWEFRNGDGNPVFGGTNFLASVRPTLRLVVKAFFKEAASESVVAETVTLTDEDGLGAVQAGPEVFAAEGRGTWTGVEEPPPAASSRAAKILCESKVGDLPKTLCVGQPQRMETSHKVKIENATDAAIEGTLVGVLEIPAFGVKSEKKEKVRVAPRANQTFEVKSSGTLRPNKTGSFSIGAITRFEGPAATPAAAAKGFDVKVCP